MTPYEALKLSQKITDLFLGLETDLMQNIAKQMSTNMEISSTSQWRIRKLAQLGALDKQNIKTIAEYVGIAPGLIREAVEMAALEEIKKLDPAYQQIVKAGILEGNVPQKISPELAKALKAFQKQAQTDLNLVNTVMRYKAKAAYTKLIHSTAELAEKQTFLDVLGKNTGGVVTGSMARTEALRTTLKEFSEKGIPAFVDKTGREWTPEAYVNMDIRTTVNNVAHQTQFNRMDEYGIDLIEVSSHAGARPLCAEDQGKIFDRSNKSKKYPHWKNSSYGKPAGILGINCGHQIYPFVEGANIQRYFPTVDKDENDRLYKESQQQRALERTVRQNRRNINMLEATGIDTSEAKRALKDNTKKLKTFCEDKGRTYRPDRTALPKYIK